MFGVTINHIHKSYFRQKSRTQQQTCQWVLNFYVKQTVLAVKLAVPPEESRVHVAGNFFPVVRKVCGDVQLFVTNLLR